MSFIDRLLEFKEPTESRRAFCRRLGIVPSQLRTWELGTTERPVEPRISSIVPLASKLGVTVGWLAAGEFPKYYTGNETDKQGGCSVPP